MQLPLACSSVIQKVLFLIRAWLLQTESPPFLESGRNNRISVDYANILLIDFCTSYFRSLYLSGAGERLSTAINLTQTILGKKS
jgi:hypothetical protein